MRADVLPRPLPHALGSPAVGACTGTGRVAGPRGWLVRGFPAFSFVALICGASKNVFRANPRDFLVASLEGLCEHLQLRGGARRRERAAHVGAQPYLWWWGGHLVYIPLPLNRGVHMCAYR